MAAATADRRPARAEAGLPPGASRTIALPYVSALDGLRAVAVLAVLIYHHDFALLPGGFLGVDMFFVLSGYLITGLLLAEWRACGSLDLRGFWARRARRLLPAMALLLGGWLIGVALFLPAELAALRRDTLAAVGYPTNWWQVVEQESYFEATGRPSFLQHLWSLAIEGQFYLLLPPMVLLVLRWGRRALPWLLLAGAAGSAALMAALYDPGADPSRVYYGTDTHATALLLGGVLACAWRPGRPAARSAAPRFFAWQRDALGRLYGATIDLAGAAGLAALAVFFLRLNEFNTFLYRGGFALAALATVVVIAAAAHPRARLLPVLLGGPLLRWLGSRSYAIYLWHWPLFLVTRPYIDVAFDGLALAALRFGATFALAELSYRFVETPVRRGDLGRLWRQRDAWLRLPVLHWRTTVGSVAATAAVVAMSLIAVSATGALQPLSIAGAPDEPGVEPLIPQAPVPAPSAPAPGTSVAPEPEPPAHRDVETAAHVPSAPVADPMRTPLLPSRPLAGVAAHMGSVWSDSAWLPVGATPAAASQPAAVDEGSADDAPTSPPAAEPPPDPLALLPLTGPVPIVTAIGDSVLLGAAEWLRVGLPGVEVVAQVGLQADLTLIWLRELQEARRLGQVLVLHVGNNGPLRVEEVDAMLQRLADVSTVLVVNNKVPRAWEAPNNRMLEEAASRYPNAVYVDWHAASHDQQDYFYDDGIHLRPEGATAYANLIARAIEEHRGG